jgi:hypothetical protein
MLSRQNKLVVVPYSMSPGYRLYISERVLSGVCAVAVLLAGWLVAGLLVELSHINFRSFATRRVA